MRTREHWEYVNTEGYCKGAAEKANVEMGGDYHGHNADASSQIVGGEVFEGCGVAGAIVQAEVAQCS